MRSVVAAAAAIVCAGAAQASDVIHTAKTAPFERPEAISAGVRDECDLPRRQVELLVAAAAAQGITLVADDEAPPSDGRVLVLKIARADSVGNAGISYHAKSVALRGALHQDGKQIGSFVGMRNSTGQALGILKSSCAVLELCLKTLADDVSRWLQNPTMNARIGE